MRDLQTESETGPQRRGNPPFLLNPAFTRKAQKMGVYAMDAVSNRAAEVCGIGGMMENYSAVILTEIERLGGGL